MVVPTTPATTGPTKPTTQLNTHFSINQSIDQSSIGHWLNLLVLSLITGVYPDANGESLRGHVMDPEDLDGAQEMQRHRADRHSVLVAVADGQPAGHHVRIAYRFHLGKMRRRTKLY